MQFSNAFSSLILAIGITVAGFFLGKSIVDSKTEDRFVTVKGLAEREVQSDRAIWPITYSVASNDLNDLQKQLEQQAEMIRRYFKNSGLEDGEISIGIPNVTDTKATYYGGNYQPFRYIGKGKMTINTEKIEAFNKSVSNITELFGKGIVIEQDEYRNRIDYQYNQLNEIKPEMIREATQNARHAAQQFADDAQAQLGRIRTASQGYFSISDRDSNTPYIKNVRVVTTIEYYLD